MRRQTRCGFPARPWRGSSTVDRLDSMLRLPNRVCLLCIHSSVHATYTRRRNTDKSHAWRDLTTLCCWLFASNRVLAHSRSDPFLLDLSAAQNPAHSDLFALPAVSTTFRGTYRRWSTTCDTGERASIKLSLLRSLFANLRSFSLCCRGTRVSLQKV